MQDSNWQPRGGGRFLEACLLCVLQEESTHGYALLDHLERFELVETHIDISVLYRTLRAMEKATLVTSHWSESDLGPRKRIYSITEAGRSALGLWIEVLKSRKRLIEQIIQQYEKGR
ncbi:MAG: helix-turn-helix transcriptional regulator [Sphaerochaeta sp.]